MDEETGKSIPSLNMASAPLKRMPPTKQDRVLARMWERMAAIYGQARWLAHAPLTTDEAPGVEQAWLDILGNLTMTDISRGIGRLEASPGDWPPGAPDFRKACHEFQPGTFAGGPQRPLPDVAALLETATVFGDARAYLDMCRRVVAEGGLTRAELETLPACETAGGQIVRPRDYCTAVDDEGFVKGKRQPHPERAT